MRAVCLSLTALGSGARAPGQVPRIPRRLLPDSELHSHQEGRAPTQRAPGPLHHGQHLLALAERPCPASSHRLAAAVLVLLHPKESLCSAGDGPR